MSEVGGSISDAVAKLAALAALPVLSLWLPGLW